MSMIMRIIRQNRMTICGLATIGLMSGLMPGFLGAATAHAQTVAPVPLASSLVPADLSVSSLIGHADRLVRAVMGLLAAASVVSWTILVAKSVELTIAGRQARLAYRLAEAGAPDDTKNMPPLLLTMRQAMRSEIVASIGAPVAGTKERMASRLHRIDVRLVRRAQMGTGILATIGSIAPFVGLFGTVWGIMNSFIGIAQSHTTNLAVVAPGIAEALLATAMGLVAAIPAVVIYNVFSRWTGGYRALIGDVSETVLRHAARSLDLRDDPDYTEPSMSHRIERVG